MSFNPCGKMKIKLLFLIIGFIAVISFSGCASLFSERNTQISFRSEPAGASVYINNKLLGVTPCLIDLKTRFRDQRVTYKLEGYDEISFYLLREFNELFWLNSLNFFIFSPIDVFITGQAYMYRNLDYFETLSKSK